MNDDSFELLTKMYSEMTTRFDAVDKKLDSKADKLDIVRLENKMDTNFKALYDGYQQSYEKICIVEMKVDGLAAKVDKQEIEIRVIKGGREIAAKR